MAPRAPKSGSAGDRGRLCPKTSLGQFNNWVGLQFLTQQIPVVDDPILVPLLVPLCTSILCILPQLRAAN
jgi:hypothetical protein